MHCQLTSRYVEFLASRPITSLVTSLRKPFPSQANVVQIGTANVITPFNDLHALSKQPDINLFQRNASLQKMAVRESDVEVVFIAQKAAESQIPSMWHLIHLAPYTYITK